jgi:hypothetical protein
MAWHEIYQLLESECDKALARADGTVDLPALSDAASDSMILAKFPESPARLTDRIIDEVCEHFATHRQWPVSGATPEIAVLLLARLAAGRDLAEFVCQAQKKAPSEYPLLDSNADSQLLLRWILIDCWHHAGFWRGIYQRKGTDDRTT